MEMDGGHGDWRMVRLYCNGGESKRNVVAITVAEILKNSLAAAQRVNARIMSLRLHVKEGYQTIIVVRIPQAVCTERDKNDFYVLHLIGDHNVDT